MDRYGWPPPGFLAWERERLEDPRPTLEGMQWDSDRGEWVDEEEYLNRMDRRNDHENE